jgi:2-polyprenyl-6-methoxyphenol hydroxylase-like FAD-dependent oxidoreductase
MERSTCVVVGGGPAGMVLGLLLARAGVEVTVLEKHNDFLRDFRGDTVHASTLTLLDELGLGPAFDEVPHRKVDRLQVLLDSGPATIASMRYLPGAHQHVAFVPQWDFLDLIADAGKQEPTFTLRMNTEFTGLRTKGRKVTGVHYRTADGVEGEIEADLVVAADGRQSLVRAHAQLPVHRFGTPMDVWWFRLPRDGSEPEGALARFTKGSALVLIDRGEYFQSAFLIHKGSDRVLRAEGIEAFRARVAALVPWLADRMKTVESLDDVKLLDVKLDRLTKWHGDGVLCIGDAAHAMSPVGGVGINLAVQDAVAAARLLGRPLLRRTVTPAVLAKVRRRRWMPTAVTQGLQRLAHRVVLASALDGKVDIQGGKVPAPVRLMHRFPVLQAIPAYIVAIGLRPEHAPAFARRKPAKITRS